MSNNKRLEALNKEANLDKEQALEDRDRALADKERSRKVMVALYYDLLNLSYYKQLILYQIDDRSN